MVIKRRKVDPTQTIYDVDNVPIPSRNTLKKYREDFDLHKRCTQSLTIARKQAQCDIRLIYSTAVFIWALCYQKPSHLIWNVDATTFECCPIGTGQKVIIHRENAAPPKQVTSTSNHDDLALLIKYVGLGNAGNKL